jgi:Major Facilitator Superfamily
MAPGRSLRVSLALAFGSTSIVWVAYSLFAVVLPFRFEALGFPVVEYGVAIAGLALGMLVTETLWGTIAFRLARPRVIVGMAAAVAVVWVGLAAATEYAELVGLLALFGALLIFQVPLIRWVAMTALGPGTRSTGTGIYGLFSGAGLVAGTALGPVVYVTVGYPVLVLGSTGLYVGGTLLTLALPWSRTAPAASDGGLGTHLREVTTRPFLLVAGLVALAFVAKSLLLNFVQYYSIALFHGTPVAAGYLIGAGLAVVLGVGAVVGVKIDRWGAARSAPIGFLLVLAGAGTTWFAASYAPMVVGTLVLAAGVGWLSAALLPLAVGPLPLGVQGTGVGLIGSFEDLGLLVGPVALGAVYAAAGPRSLFVLVAGVLGAFLVGHSTAPEPGVRAEAADGAREPL